jgi:hypothetical protein
MMIAFTILVGPKIGQLLGSKGTRAPGSTDTTFQIADVAQFKIKKHQRFCIRGPGLDRNHVLESVQGVHAFAGTTRTFFSPTLSTSLWLFGIQELLSKVLHVDTVLYTSKIGGVQIKLVAVVVCDFFFGQTARSYCADWTGF